MKLKAETRNALPKSEFGLPGSRKYPMPDKSHAGNAKARATQMVAKGKLSAGAAAKIRAKANKILGSCILFLLCSLSAHAAVRTMQVTLGDSVTQVLSAGAHPGDANITSTRGLALSPGGGSFFVAPSSSTTARDLGTWYIIGTSGDVIDVIYDDGE